jgi:hypothetical protein
MLKTDYVIEKKNIHSAVLVSSAFIFLCALCIFALNLNTSQNRNQVLLHPFRHQIANRRDDEKKSGNRIFSINR